MGRPRGRAGICVVGSYHMQLPVEPLMLRVYGSDTLFLQHQLRRRNQQRIRSHVRRTLAQRPGCLKPSVVLSNIKTGIRLARNRKEPYVQKIRTLRVYSAMTGFGGFHVGHT